MKAMPRREVTCSLECSGNNGFPWFWGDREREVDGMLTSRLAGLLQNRIEVVFWKRCQDEGRGGKISRTSRSMSLEDAMSPEPPLLR
jgi:DMSO/TMAO reductase YedYZ molybdopterin-dependent catalytic subunit